MVANCDAKSPARVGVQRKLFRNLCALPRLLHGFHLQFGCHNHPAPHNLDGYTQITRNAVDVYEKSMGIDLDLTWAVMFLVGRRQKW